MKNDLRFPWTSGVTLYARETPESPGTTDLTEVSNGIYEALDNQTYIYQQLGSSKSTDDLFVGRSRGFLYGSEPEANGFFAGRLHNWDWTQAAVPERLKGMRQATVLMDKFNFLGSKTDSDQQLEFPRGGDTDVPRAIRYACYLIADALVAGRVPAEDLEQLQTNVETIGAIRTEFNRAGDPMEHLINMIPSPEAWALIRPFLQIPTNFTVRRS